MKALFRKLFQRLVFCPLGIHSQPFIDITKGFHCYLCGYHRAEIVWPNPPPAPPQSQDPGGHF